ncbi:MAG: hypothetical protein ACRDG6_12225 [Candidatus Limnocylindria bacterium]
MRVVFETPPVKAFGKVPPRGRELQGMARFVVRVFDAGEEIPAIYDYAGPIAKWLSSLGPGQPLLSPPPESLSGPMRVAAVPRHILDSLPADSLLAVGWEFVPEGGHR